MLPLCRRELMLRFERKIPMIQDINPKHFYNQFHKEAIKPLDYIISFHSNLIFAREAEHFAINKARNFQFHIFFQQEIFLPVDGKKICKMKFFFPLLFRFLFRLYVSMYVFTP